jgi:hypothetical protein
MKITIPADQLSAFGTPTTGDTSSHYHNLSAELSLLSALAAVPRKIEAGPIFAKKGRYGVRAITGEGYPKDMPCGSG